LKCKGTAFRKRIRADFPSIDIKISDNLSKKVVILSNQLPIYNSPVSCSLMNLRKLMIYSILGCCNNESAVKHWKNMELTDSETIYGIYYKMSRLIDLTMTM
jgi:hypothetical protein